MADLGIAPQHYTDLRDYKRQYAAAYRKKFKKKYGREAIRGIDLRVDDIRILRVACEKEGTTLEAAVTAALEELVRQAREAIQSAEA